jgi:hypothetical protein
VIRSLTPNGTVYKYIHSRISRKENVLSKHPGRENGARGKHFALK